jgi:hypothetical protein
MNVYRIHIEYAGATVVATPDNIITAEMQALTPRDSFVMTSHPLRQTPQPPLAPFIAHLSIAVVEESRPAGPIFQIWIPLGQARRPIPFLPEEVGLSE